MKSVWLIVAVATLAPSIVGCGDSSAEQTRHTTTLNVRTGGLPVGLNAVDTGILQDPAAYKPAKFEPLEGMGTADAGGAAGGPVQQAIQSLITAVTEMSVDGIVDAFVPEQIAPLREDRTPLYDTADALTAFLAVMKEKYKPAGDAAKQQAGEQALLDLLKALPSALTVEMVDDDHALVGLDHARVEQLAKPLIDAISAANPMAAGHLQALPPAGDAAADEKLAMVRVEGEWRIDLQMTMTAEQGALIREGLVLVKEALSSVTQKLREAEAVDDAVLQQIVMMSAAELTPKFMEFMQKAGALMPMANAAASTSAPAEEEGPSGP